MKKSIIILLSVLAIAFTFSGCGESEGSVSAASNVDSTSAASTVADVDLGTVEAVVVVDNNNNPEDTVAQLPFNLSAAVGTPPSIPN